LIGFLANNDPHGKRLFPGGSVGCGKGSLVDKHLAVTELFGDPAAAFHRQFYLGDLGRVGFSDKRLDRVFADNPICREIRFLLEGLDQGDQFRCVKVGTVIRLKRIGMSCLQLGRTVLLDRSDDILHFGAGFARFEEGAGCDDNLIDGFVFRLEALQLRCELPEMVVLRLMLFQGSCDIGSRLNIRQRCDKVDVVPWQIVILGNPVRINAPPRRVQNICQNGCTQLHFELHHCCSSFALVEARCRWERNKIVLRNQRVFVSASQGLAHLRGLKRYAAVFDPDKIGMLAIISEQRIADLGQNS